MALLTADSVLAITILLTMQASNFCASCVSEECLVTWGSYFTFYTFIVFLQLKLVVNKGNKTENVYMGKLVFLFSDLGSSYLLMLLSTCIRELYIPYCCHIWAGALPVIYHIRVQKHIVNLAGEGLDQRKKPLSHCRSIASLSFPFSLIFMVNVQPVCPTWFLLSGYLSVKPGFLLLLTHILALPRCRIKSHSNNFIPRTACL